MKIEIFADVCMTRGITHTPNSYKRLWIFQFLTYIFSADITPEILKLWRFTKVKMFSLVLVHVFNFDLFEFSAVILKKGLFSDIVFLWREENQTH